MWNIWGKTVLHLTLLCFSFCQSIYFLLLDCSEKQCSFVAHVSKEVMWNHLKGTDANFCLSWQHLKATTMTGLINKETRCALPLSVSDITSCVRGYTLALTASMTYENIEDHAIEGERSIFKAVLKTSHPFFLYSDLICNYLPKYGCWEQFYWTVMYIEKKASLFVCLLFTLCFPLFLWL